VCDLSYMIQVEQLERMALAELTLAPHVKEGTQLATPESAVAEFDQWLLAEPESQFDNPADMDLVNLIRGR
jgi:hypothetical protein